MLLFHVIIEISLKDTENYDERSSAILEFGELQQQVFKKFVLEKNLGTNEGAHLDREADTPFPQKEKHLLPSKRKTPLSGSFAIKMFQEDLKYRRTPLGKDQSVRLREVSVK